MMSRSRNTSRSFAGSFSTSFERISRVSPSSSSSSGCADQSAIASGSASSFELCDCSYETWPSRRRRYFMSAAFVPMRYIHVENVDSALKFLSPR